MIIENQNQILNNIDSGIIILNKDRKILFWNNWLETKTKYNSKDILNKTLDIEFQNINLERLTQDIENVLSLNKTINCTLDENNYLIAIEQNHSAFEYMQQKVSISPYDTDRQQVCIYIYDETPLATIALEVKSNQEKDRLLSEQGKLASMGEMIGSIAHQWRQPLNALSGNIQFLEDDYDDGLINPEYLDKFIDKNMDLIKFMSTTIDDFRNFFKVDRDEIVFNIRPKIIETINIIQASFKIYKINVIINESDFSFYGIPSEFQQVILNILNNAKDVLISDCISNKTIIITIDSSGTITIEDNANGIDDKIMTRIFEPYFTTKDESRGTGIGLYMSKMIIEDHMRGSLRVYNKVNNTGALFEIKLNAE